MNQPLLSGPAGVYAAIGMSEIEAVAISQIRMGASCPATIYH